MKFHFKNPLSRMFSTYFEADFQVNTFPAYLRGKRQAEGGFLSPK